jgi:hypothetical protein
MALQETLLAIEEELWTGGADAYRKHLDEECMIAFSDDLVGIRAREEIAGAAAESPRWKDLDLEPRGLLRPADDVALLTYRASAVREGARHIAIASSAYVRSDGEWRMVFHQQTPLEE